MNKTPNTRQSSSKYALKEMFEMQAKKLKKSFKTKGSYVPQTDVRAPPFLSNAANNKKWSSIVNPPRFKISIWCSDIRTAQHMHAAIKLTFSVAISKFGR